MDDERILELTGKKVDITWEDELLGKQEAGGVFVGVSDDGYASLDWGYGVKMSAKGFTIKEIVN